VLYSGLSIRSSQCSDDCVQLPLNFSRVRFLSRVSYSGERRSGADQKSLRRAGAQL